MTRDLWPRGIGRPLQDRLTAQNMPAEDRWKLVGTELHEICEWAVVDCPESTNNNGAPQHVLTYCPELTPATPNASVQVVLHLQGFVKVCKLAPLGNWNGQADSAVKAAQILVLESKGYDNPFDVQKGALLNLREFILGRLGDPQTNTYAASDSIYLRRRVFTRASGHLSVRASDTMVAAVTLTYADDPQRRAEKIKHAWRIDSKPVTGVQREDGKVVECNYIAIRPGDFVDVCVSAQIVTTRRQGIPRATIDFTFDTVVRLYSAAQLSKVCLFTNSPHTCC
ncbi:hypothetical protein B0H21DRAFT_700938 [Amylocystis lapponica]|nr:hypothetical protein B0H21DRAFT_700938 [Amylocystis lapponica]